MLYKKLISLLLAGVMLVQAPLFAYAQPKSSVKRAQNTESKFVPLKGFSNQRVSKKFLGTVKSHTDESEKIKAYYTTGIQGKNKSSYYKKYQAAEAAPNQTEYWKLNSTDLYERYAYVSTALGKEFDNNPYYKRAKLQAKTDEIAGGVIITLLFVVGGEIIGAGLGALGGLVNVEFTAAINWARILGPRVVKAEKTIQTAAGVAKKPIGQRISSWCSRKVASTKAKACTLSGWADWFAAAGVFVGQCFFTESAYMVLNRVIEGHAFYNHKQAAEGVKTKDLALEIADVKDFKSFQSKFEKWAQNMEDGIEDDVTYNLAAHEMLITRLYALEYILAEMRDTSDKLRYEKAVIDLMHLYFNQYEAFEVKDSITRETALLNQATVTNLAKKSLEGWEAKVKQKQEQIKKEAEKNAYEHWHSTM